MEGTMEIICRAPTRMSKLTERKGTPAEGSSLKAATTAAASHIPDQTMECDDDDSVSESVLSDSCQEKVENTVGIPENGGWKVNDEKSTTGSLASFMSSLVGSANEDFAFCLQVDNAKPRDLPPPCQSSPNSVASPSRGSRRPSGFSRWDATPRATTASTRRKSVASAARPRAMRPWKAPSSRSMNPSSHNNSNHTQNHSIRGYSNNNLEDGSSTINTNNSNKNNKLKSDTPILRPIRADSVRRVSLSNARRPQRCDSSRCLDKEKSIRDLAVLEAGEGGPVLMESMDLRALLDEDEDDKKQASEFLDHSQNMSTSNGDIFLKIPAMGESGQSLWGSASTMTASFRTFTSFYSKESTRSLYSQGALENSQRSLLAKSDEEHPMRLPRRTDSREKYFNSNACGLPIRRPVRASSIASMASSSTLLNNNSSHRYDRAFPITGTNAGGEQLESNHISHRSLSNDDDEHERKFNASAKLPLFDDDSNCRLHRSLSEQTLVAFWREMKGERLHSSMNESIGSSSLLKRSLSDSLLFKTGDAFMASVAIASSSSTDIIMDSSAEG